MVKYLKKDKDKKPSVKPEPKVVIKKPIVAEKTVYKWPITCYFGIFNCQDNGILLKDEYIDCKFGFTKIDPKKTRV